MTRIAKTSQKGHRDFARFGLRLMKLLTRATRALPEHCFLLPRASRSPLPSVHIKRERVYAYELYQLRTIWPARYPYKLTPEPDKKSHPLFDGTELQDANSDLIVREAGTSARDLAVIELKRGDSQFADWREDIETLNRIRESRLSPGLVPTVRRPIVARESCSIEPRLRPADIRLVAFAARRSCTAASHPRKRTRELTTPDKVTT